jgi:hypothetical protein
MTPVTPESSWDRAVVFFTEVGILLGRDGSSRLSQRLGRRPRRARTPSDGQDLEEASPDLGAGRLDFRQTPRASHPPSGRRPARVHVLVRRLLPSFFAAGAGTSTLPLYIFSSLRLA